MWALKFYGHHLLYPLVLSAVATGLAVDDFQTRQPVGCFTVTEWLGQNDYDARLVQALAAAYRQAAEEVVDEFYLVYHPPLPADQAVATSAVPGYVLAPLEPPPPEVYLDIKLFPKTKDLQGFGGMHFHDLDTVRPALAWEPLTRISELAAASTAAFSEVTYELRMFRGGRSAVAVAPVELIHEVSGLTATEYQIPSDLEPCSWYFWTVRARFRLNETWRTTEWAGAYHTAGGHYSPSSSRRNVGSRIGFVWPAHYLYFPLRTPALDPQVDCWSS